VVTGPSHKFSPTAHAHDSCPSWSVHYAPLRPTCALRGTGDTCREFSVKLRVLYFMLRGDIGESSSTTREQKYVYKTQSLMGCAAVFIIDHRPHDGSSTYL
jgi:hypothetical protein